MTSLMFSPGDDADGQGAEDQRQERVHLGQVISTTISRDAEQRGGHQLPAAGDRARPGCGCGEGDRCVHHSHCVVGVVGVLVDVGLDDGVDALVDVDHQAVLVGCERLEGGELRVEQRGRHEVARGGWPGAGRSPRGCRARCTNSVRGACAAQLVAVLALQRRAAHHAAGLVVLGQPLPDRLEPGLPVVVVQRVPAVILAMLAGGWKSSASANGTPQPLGEGRARRSTCRTPRRP